MLWFVATIGGLVCTAYLHSKSHRLVKGVFGAEKRMKPLICFAPLFKSAVFFLIWFAVALRWSDYFFVLAGWELLDNLKWWLEFSFGHRFTDGGRFRLETKDW